MRSMDVKLRDNLFDMLQEPENSKKFKEKVSKEELKKRWEAAKKKRDAKRGDAKRKGHNHKGPRGEFGKLVRNDEKIKELKKEGWGAIKIAKHLNKTRDFVYKAIEKLEEE